MSGATLAETEKATPLIRDVRTGYLMNCTFRAIRPYIWKQVPILTGWETNARGGTWESSPSGFFPDQFAFHKDWFKLRDTSAEHPVTIRRQIARQTEHHHAGNAVALSVSGRRGMATPRFDQVAVGLVAQMAT
jgi:hypothetical protein